MKGKTKRSRQKLGLPTAILFCALFFLIGFYGSTLLSQSQDVPKIRPRLRMLEMEKKGNDGLMANGETGEAEFQSIPFQVLSWKPRALYFPNFATAEQCQKIIEMAKVHLRPSGLALRKGETVEGTKDTRTSSGTFLSGSEDETGTLDIIEQKIARATMIPQSHGEPFNILRYELGQKYDAHYDAFNPTEYGPQKSQRMASFLLYLSDVEEGGETMFPLENGLKTTPEFDFKKCMGLKVKPRRGDGLLFYSLFPNGTIDPPMLGNSGVGRTLGPVCLFLTEVKSPRSMRASLHGSCPVIKGEKWVATKWIRNQDLDD